jgi:thiol:disulfide interchange protein DsbC
VSKYIHLLIFPVAVFLTLGSIAHAEDTAEARIRQALNSKFPQAKITRIEKTPIEGVYEVELPPHIIYMSQDAKYVLNGELIDLQADRNITQEKLAKTRIAEINKLGEDSMIVFAPKHPKYTVSVFTDLDCGYCRKLHSEIDEYNKLGIKVRYLAYPRAGPGSASFKKAEQVWCAKDRKQALTDAKQGKPVKSKECQNPVKAHFITGTKVGVRGTPAIFLENGQMLPGYYPADRLLKILQQSKK